MPAIHIATPTSLFGLSSWDEVDDPASDLGIARAAMGPVANFVDSSMADVEAWLGSAPTTVTSFGNWTDVLPFVQARLDAGTHKIVRDPVSTYFILVPV